MIAKAALVRRFDSLQRWMDALDFADSGDAGRWPMPTRSIAANKRDFDARFAKARC